MQRAVMVPGEEGVMEEGATAVATEEDGFSVPAVSIDD